MSAAALPAPDEWPDRIQSADSQSRDERDREACRMWVDLGLTWGQIAFELNQAGYPPFLSPAAARISANRYSQRVYGRKLPTSKRSIDKPER